MPDYVENNGVLWYVGGDPKAELVILTGEWPVSDPPDLTPAPDPKTS
jgi:hypothetical protein